MRTLTLTIFIAVSLAGCRPDRCSLVIDRDRSENWRLAHTPDGACELRVPPEVEFECTEQETPPVCTCYWWTEEGPGRFFVDVIPTPTSELRNDLGMLLRPPITPEEEIELFRDQENEVNVEVNESLTMANWDGHHIRLRVTWQRPREMIQTQRGGTACTGPSTGVDIVETILWQARGVVIRVGYRIAADAPDARRMIFSRMLDGFSLAPGSDEE